MDGLGIVLRYDSIFKHSIVLLPLVEGGECGVVERKVSGEFDRSSLVSVSEKSGSYEGVVLEDAGREDYAGLVRRFGDVLESDFNPRVYKRVSDSLTRVPLEFRSYLFSLLPEPLEDDFGSPGYPRGWK